MIDGSGALQSLRLIDEEVRRRMALGVPRGVDRSDLVSAANEALVVAAAKGVTALRLAVRCALQNLIARDVMIQSHAGEMPDEVTSDQSPSRIDPELLDELVYDLSPRQMTAVRLYFYEGLTQDAAAALMGCTRENVCMLLRGAENNLREALTKRHA